ncbi:MAG TPA: dTMP kinase [Armatimonadota bacterium]|nr:dTMP kinase [Armatimonadota bacterium]
MSRRGFFITLEGPEGSGKSTQVRLLADTLRNRGYDVLLTAEPGGDAVAQEIRAIVLHSKAKIVPEAELLLYLAARAQHVRHIINPALDEGKIVISDRYADSSFAYQGYGRGIDIESLRCLNDFATSGLKPDLTILLDVPVELGLKRQQDRNRFEAESVEFHQRVRNGFLKLAKQEPDRWVTIDASKEIEEVESLVIKVLEARFPKI